MIPIKEEYDKVSNKELLQIISKKEKLNINYYPILAKRMKEDSRFEKFLLTEISSEDNINEIFFGFAKIAWIPLLSIIEYSTSNFINKGIIEFKKWSETEKEIFLNYIKNEKKIIKYF
ncbi:hypothetical protein I6H88_10240 [Elizabethkingia bruuniana]|uniref:Uncharacterized protein n=1 Tax=Elizabethkingia bruuniana TaxID=1756149 RepID=A0A7T7V399_9FLAO|nr:hypothetical protein [Elizabethkingia bruuniana]KGO09365.1 hypothetical protein KS04_15105 [Elizabethkingia miricola]AQX87183.1 hypothetical protein AYC65_20230 [Elizabethkingia bruuniana]KUY23861.1 hypothetical protein ATB97_10820 [Elizabethkingia bruuniana]OPB61547.1 hypothetical protein BAY12_13805 [Elizabethkingia bruuniana]QQN60921.1 hypothetical protein I6H88_10240 [Elizabethkingia bruuniana]